ncbi:MAG: ribosome maturation factor RimM [Roseburia sp.]|nr:ribosome maturation factor RimM [Roseburia sp.]MCM1099707.1 ribosome maturation factor RimM [Ruminococcus flavefaciens]
MEEFFQVGVITSTHGLKGEVKVFPTTDDPKRFKKLKEVLLDTGKERICLEVEGAKFFKQFVILKLEGIDTIEAAERYRKASLLVSRKNAVRLSRDEYFVADLMGLRVRDEDGGEIGVLREVMETGANDVYIIDLDDGRELLLPAIKQCVLEVNVAAGFIRIHILEGLLEDQVRH